MRFIDSCRLAKSNLSRSRARSFLTIFGVAVGVTAIVLLVSLAIGLERLTTERIASTELLTTLTVNTKEGSDRILNDVAVTKFLEVKNVVNVSPSIKSAAQATYNNVTTSSLVYGISDDSFKLEGLNIEEGADRFTDEKDIIVSRALAKTLGIENPGSTLNQKIKIKLLLIDDSIKMPEEIEEELNIIGIDKNDTVGLAYTNLSWLKKNLNKDEFDTVKIKVNDRKNVAEVKKKIEDLGYVASTVSDLIAQIETIFLVLEIILGIIGGIGLVVASIGIINTMTIALLERTHEIGIMKAVGASNSDVRRIFLSEAIMIASIGGFVGLIVAVVIGFLLNLGVNLLIEMSGNHQKMYLFVTPYQLSLLILGLTIVIGILTGIYPARRAAKLSPLKALHIE